MFSAENVGTIFQAVIVAWIIFITQDYIRFRFKPPYVTKEACSASHNAANIIADERKKTIEHLSDRIEARMDRLEGLIMVMMTRKGKDGSEFSHGYSGMDASGKG